MGKVTNNGITGLVGNLVFYTRDGKNYVRTKPARKSKRRRVQTPERKLFGVITRYGSRMVKLAGKLMNYRLRLASYNHMRAWMRHLYLTRSDGEWILNAQESGMCQLNTDADLRNIFKPVIQVTAADRIISVNIPSLDPVKEIIAPPRTTHIILKAIVATSDFKKATQTNYAEAEHTIIYTAGQLTDTTIVLDPKAGAGEIAVVFIALSFVTKDATAFLNESKWLPTAAVAMGRL